LQARLSSRSGADTTKSVVLASLTAPLVEARISVFVISTFDTDYLLVKEEDFEKAISALEQAGHSITK
jgi:hypothetical protein